MILDETNKKNVFLARTVRILVGLILLLESLCLLLVAPFIAGLALLMSAFSFVVSAGNATAHQIHMAWAAVGLTVVAPFLMAAAVGTAGVLLLIGTWRRMIVASGVTALVGQLAFHLLAKEPFSPVALLPFTLHLAAIVTAILFVGRPSESTAS